MYKHTDKDAETARRIAELQSKVYAEMRVNCRPYGFAWIAMVERIAEMIVAEGLHKDINGNVYALLAEDNAHTAAHAARLVDAAMFAQIAPRTYPAPPVKIAVDVDGGLVAGVYATQPDRVTVHVVDRDNAAAGDTDAEKACADMDRAIERGTLSRVW